MELLNRRSLLQVALGAVTGAVAGCGAANSNRSGGGARRELRVFVYAGAHEQTMREVFVPRFEALERVVVTLYSGWWDGIPKLKAAPANAAPFDLMITDATQGIPAAREGLFQPLELDNIPNLRNLAPRTLDHWIHREKLGVPYPDAVMTLAYHRELVPNAPTRWADLLRPDLKGRLGLYSSFYMSLFTFAAILADVNGRPGEARRLIAENLDDVFRFAREHRVAVGLWWSTSSEMILALNDRRFAAGNMHSPEYLLALRERPVLAAAVPALDRAMVQVFWAVPRGTPNRELAERALELLFSPEVQRELAQRGMATSDPQVARQMAEEDPMWKNLYPHAPEDFDADLYYPYDLYAPHWDDLADRWDRTILRDG